MFDDFNRQDDVVPLLGERTWQLYAVGIMNFKSIFNLFDNSPCYFYGTFRDINPPNILIVFIIKLRCNISAPATSIKYQSIFWDTKLSENSMNAG